MARASGLLLSRLACQDRPLTLRVADAGQEQAFQLPVGAVGMLMEILEAMAAGQRLRLVPENVELTTVQAAGILNVSRPFLISLLEQGRIPCRKVGKHRRIRTEDVLTYKQTIDRDREAVLDRLAAEAQANDMGYPRS